MTFTIRKAERRQAKLRLGLTGVSGSGKTTGSLFIAKGMGGRTILIDTESRSADLYAHIMDFDVICLEAPFTPERYVKAIETCEKAGYDIIIIDSLSHAWMGEGGALEMHDNATASSSSKNSYLAWREVTPWHNKLVNKLLQSMCHIIVTMRSKTHYDLIDDGGRKRPIKVGLAPLQRDGMEYEFTTVLNIDQESHLYRSSKDRTGLFEGNPGKISEETGRKLVEWLNAGKSSDEVMREENKRISAEKQSMLEFIKMSETMDALNRNYHDAVNKYRDMENEFKMAARQRRDEITKNNNVEMH